MTFGIIGNTGKKNIKPVLGDIILFLQKQKIEFLLQKELKKFLQIQLSPKYLCSVKTLVKRSDMILSLGGDGTFLNTAKIVGRKQIPILGVNLGTLGFMAEVGPKEVISFINKILNNKYKIYNLCVLEAKHSGSEPIYGMNDIVIDKCASIKMVELEIFYKDEHVIRFFADGIIVSTPTGSTGYSLSAGGNVISPYSQVFAITPICPHTLNFRPLIVPEDGEILIKTHHTGTVRITADGSPSITYKSPTKFRIRKADYTVRVVKDIDKTYFQTLSNKLLWGADQRKK
ncbi:MAG: NAD(+)/NADH kinase [Ignavibacteria bacterium]